MRQTKFRHAAFLLISAFNLFATVNCSVSSAEEPVVIAPMSQSSNSTPDSKSESTSDSTSSVVAANTQTVALQFGGSLCPVCLNAFKNRLLATDGVSSVDIVVEKKTQKSGHPPKIATATVDYTPEKISKDILIETIKRNDFQFLTAREIKKSEKAD